MTGKVILLVEDNPRDEALTLRALRKSNIVNDVAVVRDGVEALALLLTLEGHEVRAAYDGASGLEIAGEFGPDVAVIDLGLPGMDGFEVAKKLREMLPNAQLIALSGWHRDQMEQRGLQLFDHYLRKPVELHELTELLH